MKEYIVAIKELALGFKSTDLREEVVRCRDCKRWRANTQFCSVFSGLCTAHRMPPNGYCSEAKREEE